MFRLIFRREGHTLGAEELSRDVDGFGTDNHNALTVQELFGDNRGKTTLEMALAVNNDLVIDLSAFVLAIEPRNTMTAVYG